MIDFSWFSDLQPWVQGGGRSWCHRLWYAVIKPGRDTRSLAHVLSEEMAQNLNLVALQLDVIRAEHSPESVRPWHPLSSIVFESVVQRLGELPRLIGKVVAIYQVLEIVNRYPPMIIAEWYEISPGLPGSPGHPTLAQTQKLKHINGLLATFEGLINSDDILTRFCLHLERRQFHGIELISGFASVVSIYYQN